MTEYETQNSDDFAEADEQLTAYLDDELSPDERADVETKLAGDSMFRHRLTHLQRAWDLLDTLPKAEAPRDFTQSTVEMIATKAVGESQAIQTTVRSKRWIPAAAVTGATVAAIVGFVAVYAALHAPNRQLLTDLPVIEHLDEYRYADSLEFLELLDDQGLFEEEVNDESI